MRAVVVLVVLLLAVAYADKAMELAKRAQQDASAKRVVQRQSGCPNACSGHGRCFGRDCSCNPGWAGDDCSLADSPVTFNTVYNGNISIFSWQYYHIPVPANTGFMVIVNQTSMIGDCDAYVQKDDYPTLSRYYAKDVSLDTNFVVSVPRATPGMWYIGVYAFFTCSYRITVRQISTCPNGCSGNGVCQPSGNCTCSGTWTGADCSIQATPVNPNTPYQGSVQLGGWQYYSYYAQVGAQLLFSVQEAAGGLNDDCDLYVAYNRIPTLLSWDLANETKASYSSLQIQSTRFAGTYYVGVYGYSSCSYTFLLQTGSGSCPNNCTLRGTCDRGAAQGCSCSAGYNGTYCEYQLAMLQPNAAVGGFVSPGAWNHYSFRLNTASPAIITVTQSTTLADCDVYIKANARPSRFDYDFFNIDTSAVFNVTIANPGAIVWYVGVYGWSGSTSYSLALSVGNVCNCGANGVCSSVPGECICNAGWAGDYCNIQVPVLNSAAVVHTSVRSGSWLYYSFTLPSTSSLAIVTLHESATRGYLWLYISTEDIPSTLNNQFSSKTPSTAVQEIIIRQPNSHPSTVYYVGVFGNPYAPQGLSTSFDLVVFTS